MIITTIKEINDCIAHGIKNFTIMLWSGTTSRYITKDGGYYYVFNECGNITDELTESELLNQSIIGLALKNGRLCV